MAQARYGIPVMSSLHDIEVPKHLGLYKDHGVGWAPEEKTQCL